MRDRLVWLARELGWLGPAIVGLILLGGGWLIYVVHLAQAEAPSQYGFPTPTVIQRLPGAVPQDFPVAVALPPGGRVVETVVYAEHQTHVRVEAPGAVRELVGFYARDLEAQGWRLVPWASHPDQGSAVFCHPTDGPGLTVLAGPPRAEALGDALSVQIMVQTNVRGHCIPDMRPPDQGGRLAAK